MTEHRPRPIDVHHDECMARAEAERAAADPAEAHRLALSEALGLGTGAPWDAIRERATEMAAAAVRVPATDRTALTERITKAVQGVLPMSSSLACEVVADAVLAVLPAPADRASVLRDAETALRTEAKRLTCEFNDSDILHEDGPAATVATWKRAADLLRRLAAEPAADTPDQTQDGHVCKPGASTYFCPTSGQTESDCHGGFDQCCDRPDLHTPAVGGAQQPKEVRA
ncbi:hypothetical protein [Streptomyces sp. NPDC048256]|uniref:hypothetical protein n=1 Tax=Streptomyces sp. NPDC048256 TaxID=3154613 RepID=UPI0033F2221E